MAIRGLHSGQKTLCSKGSSSDDHSNPIDCSRAAISQYRLVLSTQVLLETWWVLTRRLAEPLEENQASEVIDRLSELPVVSTDPQLVKQAIDTCRRFDLAIWDALIFEAARAAGCKRVLSEEFQTGQDFDGVTVENPFGRG